jgi:hypothetical protein
MQINYCDLCDCVLENGRHVIIIVKDKDFAPQATGSYTRSQQPERATYEVCDKCVELLEKVFEYKKDKVAKIKDWLDETYSLEMKPKQKKRKEAKNDE